MAECSSPVLVLFAASLLTKQQTIALPALLLLTDFWWNPGFSLQGIRANWKLYATLALGAAAGIAFFWRLITTATTAGFGLKDLTWYQYFFTECRALFVYMREFVLPFGLTADWDFPISKTILDRGAVFGLAALLALAAAAWHYRRRYPLATFGFFTFLVTMAPTSSILPIRDPMAERRLYFGILGLILAAAGLLSRVKLPRRDALAAAGSAVLLIFAVATHARAEVWGNAVALWQDTAEKSPEKARAHFPTRHGASADAGTFHAEQAAAECDEDASRFPAGGLHPARSPTCWWIGASLSNAPGSRNRPWQNFAKRRRWSRRRTFTRKSPRSMGSIRNGAKPWTRLPRRKRSTPVTPPSTLTRASSTTRRTASPRRSRSTGTRWRLTQRSNRPGRAWRPTPSGRRPGTCAEFGRTLSPR